MKESKPRILIVEDQARVQSLMEDSFNQDGRFNIDIVDSAHVALKLAYDNYYSAYVYDTRNEYNPNDYFRFLHLVMIAERIRSRYPYAAMAFYCKDNCHLLIEHAGELDADVWTSTNTNEIGLPSKVAELLEKNKFII